MLSKFSLYARSAICTVYFRLHGVQSSLVGCDGFLPVLRSPGTIRIGKRFVVRGRIARCELATKDARSRLLIGDGVFINQGTVIAAAESVEIGDGTLIGDFGAIYDSNFHDLQPGMPDKPRPVSIGKNVWLGNGVLYPSTTGTPVALYVIAGCVLTVIAVFTGRETARAAQGDRG